MKNYILHALVFFLYFSFFVKAQDADEYDAILPYIDQCTDLKMKFSKSNNLSIDCFSNYFQMQSNKRQNYSKKNASKAGKIRIASFNLLHPGMAKTKFKDFSIVAKIINQWDLLAATELLPLMKEDIEFNLKIKNFIELLAPNSLVELENKLRDEKNKSSKLRSKELINEYKSSIERLKSEIKLASSLYRKPGYFRILEELHKLPNGKNWSLILTSRGDASSDKDVQELVGFFYRSNIVNAVTNKFCQKIEISKKDLKSYGCLVPMTSNWSAKNYRPYISRRPFMASFQSNNFNFSLIAAHVVFTSKDDPSEINNLFFNNVKIEGVNKQNHDRVAETKATLEFMQYLNNSLQMKNLIYTGDFNLEAKEKFWPTILQEFPESKVFVTDPTSVSESKFRNNTLETFGVASNYDHFIFKPNENLNCLNENLNLNGGVYNYFNDTNLIPSLIHPYIIRNNVGIDEEKRQSILNAYDEILKDPQYLSYVTKITKKDIGTDLSIASLETDDLLVQRFRSEFEDRVIASQISDETFYKVYVQLISDHMPIYMTCNN